MKKILLVTLAAGLFIFATNTFGNAYQVTPSEERGYIMVDASSDVEIQPDTVEIRIAVKTSDTKSMQKATQQNKEISDKVYNTIKGMINSAQGDYIKTANFSANPVYTYNSNKKVFDKYEVANSIIVHTKNVDKVGSMIDNAISLGATNIDDLSFSVSNYENKCNDLLASVAKKARDKADIIAKASSTYITGVKSISNSCSMSGNQRVQYRLMAKSASNDMMSAGVAEATPVSSGVIKIYANINASYFVK